MTAFFLFYFYPKWYLYGKKILPFGPVHPKGDQNVQFLPLSKTTSIPQDPRHFYKGVRHVPYVTSSHHRGNAEQKARTISPPQLLQTLISHWGVTTNKVIFDNTRSYMFRLPQGNRQGARPAQYPQRNTTCGLGWVCCWFSRWDCFKFIVDQEWSSGRRTIMRMWYL